MKVTIKRNTGVMGGLARISLFVDGEERMKMQNEEEQMMMIDKEEIEIKVKQLFLGSKKVQIKRDEQLEIKINPLCIALYIIALFTTFLAWMSQGGNQKLLFMSIGFIMFMIAILFSFTSYFMIESNPVQKGE